MIACAVQFRYSLLSQAGLEAPLLIDCEGKGVYGQDIIFVANDWMTSLVVSRGWEEVEVMTRGWEEVPQLGDPCLST